MSNGVETRTVPVGGGRELCLEIAGDPDGKPILVEPGEPMSRRLYGGWIADAEKKGIRLIGIDRPGYGGSTAHPGYTVASHAADIRVIAEALGYDRFGIWGISGGGPYALGCAALLSDMVVAVAAVASLAPYGVEGFDFYDGMGASNVEGFQLFFTDPEASRLDLREGAEEILAATPEQFGADLESLLSPADAEVLTGDLLRWLTETHQVALSAGDQGWWDDGAAKLASWGFDVGGIRVPVKIWHGRQDRFVPVRHGQWLAASVPGAEADISDRDGHLTMIGRVGDIHDWLLARFAARNRQALDPCGQGRGASGGGPGAEFLGVADYPDAPDPVARDVEREHRDDGAVLLDDQAGLAVDGALAERRVAGDAVGDLEPGAGDLLGALDGVQEGERAAAAVGGRGGVRVEQVQADAAGDGGQSWPQLLSRSQPSEREAPRACR